MKWRAISVYRHYFISLLLSPCTLGLCNTILPTVFFYNFVRAVIQSNWIYGILYPRDVGLTWSFLNTEFFAGVLLHLFKSVWFDMKNIYIIIYTVFGYFKGYCTMACDIQSLNAKHRNSNRFWVFQLHYSAVSISYPNCIYDMVDICTSTISLFSLCFAVLLMDNSYEKAH